MNNKSYLCYARYLPPISALKKAIGSGDEKLRRLIWNIQRNIPYPLGSPHPTEHSLVLKRRLRFRAGINHISVELDLLLKEALHLNCTAVVPPMILNPRHNLGIDANNSVSEYYDLAASFLITEKGEKKPLNYILAEDFFRLQGNYRMRFFSMEETILPREATKKTIIIRKKTKTSIRNLENKHALYDFWNRTRLHLELAAPLKQTAKQVTAKLGRYYVLRCRLPWDKHQPYRVELVKKHIARQPKSIPILQHFLSGEGLCRQLIKVFPPGSNLFIASNLWRPYDEEYFGPLRRLYKVYRYYDLPELAGFAAGENPNTGQLRLIERTIQENSVDSVTIEWTGPALAASRLQKLVNMPDA